MKTAGNLNRYLVFFLVSAIVCAIDLGSKTWMFSYLGMPGTENSTRWLWKDIFALQTSVNPGALFGLGQGFWPLFSALSIGAAIGILFWLFGAGAAKDWLLTIALALVMAGILGNLYDRLGLHGLKWPHDYGPHAAGETMHVVRDFILVMIGPFHWPNFNIADSSLCCGAVLLMIHAFFSKTHEPTETPQ